MRKINKKQNNNNLVEYHLNNYKYLKKPNDSQAGTITNNILKTKQKTTTIQELANHLIQGKTVMLGIMPNEILKYKPVNILVSHQHLFFVDIDNKTGNFLTLQQALNHKFVQDNACFIYNTFSNESASVDKFRIVFKTNVNLTNHLQVQAMYQYLFNQFPKGAFDTGTTNASRLFFGGNNLKEINYNNVVNVPSYILNIKVNSTEIAKAKEEAINKKIAWLGRIPSLVVDSNTPTHFLLKNNDFQQDPAVKNRWNLPAKNFNSIKEFCNYFNKLNTFTLLGIKKSQRFRCVVTSDNNPSANIFKNQDGVYIYKRFSSEASKNYKFNNIQLMEKLFRLNFMQTVVKLLYLTNCQIKSNTDNTNLFNNLNSLINVLNSPNLKDTHPNIYKIFSYYIQPVTYLLNLLSHSFTAGEMLSVFSNKFLAKMVYGAGDKQKKINVLINLLAFTTVIHKPQSHQTNAEVQSFLSNKSKYGNHVTAIAFNNLNNVVENVNHYCSILVHYNLTAYNINFDTVTRITSISYAKKIFNQNKSTKLSKKSKELEDYLTKLVLNTIQSNNYIAESTLISHLQQEFSISINTAKYYLKGILANLLVAYNLQSVCLNKQLKQQFNVSHLYSSSQCPKIICMRN